MPDLAERIDVGPPEAIVDRVERSMLVSERREERACKPRRCDALGFERRLVERPSNRREIV